MKRKMPALLLALALNLDLLMALSARAQPPVIDPTIEALRRDMDELIQGQIELQKQVQDLKAMLQSNQACAQAPKQNIVFDVGDAPAKGDANAPVTVIEFSDFQCPFSGRYTNETFPLLDQDYINTGKVHYVFRDFPLENIHPLAHKLAESAQCAFEAKRFWEMRAQLFVNQSAITSEEVIVDRAKQVGLDTKAIQKCLRDSQHKSKIDQERAEASANGVTGTPTFFIGVNDPTSKKVKVLKVIVGQQPYENFKQAIEGVLGTVKTPADKI